MSPIAVDLGLIERAVGPLLDQEAVELVDLQYAHEGGRWVLRFFVDKEGGTTVADCEYLSNRIGGLIDVEGLLPHSYVLEVSSPGLDRRLKSERDFRRFAGHLVRVRLREGAPKKGDISADVAARGARAPSGCAEGARARPGPRRSYTGVLQGLEDGAVVLETGGRLERWPLDRVEEARLVPRVEF